MEDLNLDPCICCIFQFDHTYSSNVDQNQSEPRTYDAILVLKETHGLALHEWIQAPYFAIVDSATAFAELVYERRTLSVCPFRIFKSQE
jgi:hypothetical protein